MRIQISLSGSGGEIIPGGVYSAVRPIGSSANQLKMLMEVVKEFSPKVDDLHCTILFSRNKNDATGHPPSAGVHAANIRDFMHWKGHDGELYLVARLDSPALHKAFRAWSDLGYTSDYSDYRPHITIAKGLSKEDCVKAADLLTLEYFKKPFVITFGPQKVEPLRD